MIHTPEGNSAEQNKDTFVIKKNNYVDTFTMRNGASHSE